MLIRNWLSCALIVLLALQSVLAVADVHQPHQSGKEYLAFDHQPDSAEHHSQPINPLASKPVPRHSGSMNPGNLHPDSMQPVWPIAADRRIDAGRGQVFRYYSGSARR